MPQCYASKCCLTKSSLLVLDGNITACGVLVLAPDEVRNLFVLRLLNSTLIILRSLSEEFLLNEIDTPRAKRLY
jgi:hypothetical protein